MKFPMSNFASLPSVERIMEVQNEGSDCPPLPINWSINLHKNAGSFVEEWGISINSMAPCAYSMAKEMIDEAVQQFWINALNLIFICSHKITHTFCSCRSCNIS